jgi:hypothetical protein
MAESGNNTGKNEEAWGCGCLIVIVLIVVGWCIAGFNSLTESGWIQHSQETPVWIQGDWLVGEYRECQMRTKTVPPQQKDLDSLEKLPRLFCASDANGLYDFQRVAASDPPPPDAAPKPGWIYYIGVTGTEFDHYFHIMPIHYYGRIDREDKWVISWRCQRASESLTCKALN